MWQFWINIDCVVIVFWIEDFMKSTNDKKTPYT